jgi:phage/plasmid-like protein (TIGR03299 family)
MAANLDRNTTTGAGAMFSVKETPWHRDGAVLTEAPTLEEALELAGHNFDVELRPVYMRKETESGEEYFVKAERQNLIVRTDRDAILGQIGAYYTPLQNRDAFRVLEPLLDAGLVELETGGTLLGGRDVWMMARFKLDNPVVQEVFADEVVPFAMISNNHSGSRAVIVQETPIRVALRGMTNGVRVRHTSDVEAKTVAAAESLWASINERYGKVAEAFSRLKGHYLDQAMFRKLVLDVAAPIPTELKGTDLTPRQKTTLERLEEKRERLTALWTEGDGHTGDNSAWEAFNAVVQSVDHDDEIWKVRTQRTQQLVAGSLYTVKNEVGQALLAAASKKAKK